MHMQYLYVPIHACCMNVCVCIHIHIYYVCVRTHKHAHTHTHTTHTHTQTRKYMYIHMIHTGTDQKMRATVSKSQKANILESPFHSGSMSICTRALIFENFCQGRQRQEAKKGGRLQGGKTRFVFSGGGEDPREPLAFVSIVIVCVCWHPINAKNVNRYLHKM